MEKTVDQLKAELAQAQQALVVERLRSAAIASDKREHIREQFQRLLARKAAGEPQKGHLIRQAQAVVVSS